MTSLSLDRQLTPPGTRLTLADALKIVGMLTSFNRLLLLLTVKQSFPLPFRRLSTSHFCVLVVKIRCCSVISIDYNDFL